MSEIKLQLQLLNVTNICFFRFHEVVYAVRNPEDENILVKEIEKPINFGTYIHTYINIAPDHANRYLMIFGYVDIHTYIHTQHIFEYISCWTITMSSPLSIT